MKALALSAIGVYRRYISPHKGFCCAYRVHRQAASCSHLGERAVRRHGVLGGVRLLRRRLARCADVHRAAHKGAARLQRGSCDIPCDIPCDGTELKGLGHACNCIDCGSCGGEGKQRDKRSRR